MDTVFWINGVWMDCLLFIIAFLFLLPLERMKTRYYQSALFFLFEIFVLEGIRLLLYYNQIELGMINEFLIRFAFVYLGIAISYRKIGWETFYCSVWPVVLFNCIGMMWEFLRTALNDRGSGVLVEFVGVTVFFGTIYGILMVTIIRWMPRNGGYQAGPRRTISALVILILERSAYYAYKIDLTIPRLTLMIQIYCITFLYLQAELFKKSEINEEMNMLNHLWHQEKKQYEITKEQMQLIDRKCHDLKYQVEVMRNIENEEIRKQNLLELEKSIQIYESIVKTGNDILDTLLSERSLICEARGIKIHCVIDGKRLNFMNPIDIYSMFGNAIDNAIECVEKFSDPEKRFIDIGVSEKQKFLFIRISNPIGDEPEYHGGLPKTTKNNKEYHGFGLKSIRHIAEKYGGKIAIGTEFQCFVLKILLPLST
ncbi:MAG TPA: sensor histidine kinase [Candidatus Merdenecus merdavium]|nr:sensor histidine kinase [Candidatus Merdenecus merdavium]